MGLIIRLTVFLLFATGFLSAQTVLHTSHDTTSQKKQHIKVSVINPHGKQPIEYSGHSMHSDSVQQGIKINFFNFARGEFALYYETRISDQWSVEAAGGVTYTDYIYEIVSNGGEYLSIGQLTKPPVKFYSGFTGRIQCRWYPSPYETAITGYYFAPELSYRNYKMDYFVYTGLISEPRRIERKWTDLKLQFGYQTADPYENIFWDWYVSAGARRYNETYKVGSGFEATFENNKGWGFVVGAGVKIGFTL
jgi:hypothetical protein